MGYDSFKTFFKNGRNGQINVVLVFFQPSKLKKANLNIFFMLPENMGDLKFILMPFHSEAFNFQKNN